MRLQNYYIEIVYYYAEREAVRLVGKHGPISTKFRAGVSEGTCKKFETRTLPRSLIATGR